MTEPKPPQVYSAICAVAAALAKEGISKDRKNQQQGYSFRGIDDVYNALAPCLAASGLCILPRITERVICERASAKGGVLFSVTVRAEFDFVAAADGSRHTITTYGEAMDSADKATNKAMSAAYKYACMQAFCIPTEGDNDADAHTPEVALQAPQRPVAVSASEANRIVALQASWDRAKAATSGKQALAALLAASGLQSAQNLQAVPPDKVGACIKALDDLAGVGGVA